jgi:hypothetical protein
MQAPGPPVPRPEGLFRIALQNIGAAYQFHAETAFQLGITMGETDLQTGLEAGLSLETPTRR